MLTVSSGAESQGLKQTTDRAEALRHPKTRVPPTSSTATEAVPYLAS